MTVPLREGLLPFIVTDQYRMFNETCDYIRRLRTIGLVYGAPGTGKSSAARQYAAEQPTLAVNGLSPVLHVELEQSDKTDRAFYNTLVGALLRQPAENVTAKVAANEAKRLLLKYQVDFITIDEFQFLQDTGLEAVRTLWDKTRIPTMLITMTQFRSVLRKERHHQLHSRIARFLPFDRLSPSQIRRDLLPRVSVDSHISFEASQPDAEEIVKTLHDATQGNFRQIAKVLDQVNELIAISREDYERHKHNPQKREQHLIRRLDAASIQDAAAMTGDITEADTQTHRFR